MTVLICGRGRVAVDVLQYAVARQAAGFDDVRLLACPSRGDAGVDTWQPSLVAAAQALGVPLVDIQKFRDEPDLLLLSLEYDRIIDTEAFASTRLYNIHFSALPAYRGVYTSIWPILNGEAESGVTLHAIDPGVDTGAIVAQQRFPLAATETARTLFERLHTEATSLVTAWLPGLIAGEIETTPQTENGASLYRRSGLDLERARVLDLSQSAQEMDRRVRAFYFPEYQTATFHGQGVRACRDTGQTAAPGRVLVETSRSAIVSAQDGRVVELVWVNSSNTGAS